MRPVTVLICAVSIAHIILGLLSIVIGVTSSVDAEVWMAHRVSPIWSGSFVSLSRVCSRTLTVKLIESHGCHGDL